uniref:Peptidoglycan hydrolase n=1 Tax=Myoviridae sp. ctMnh10 TaxID=2827682 RepID=A0A8S5TI89_9CAUD|nr:MAG TPA: peptidoglycan hydrolase [Myoviridae sp. ctMnh10]
MDKAIEWFTQRQGRVSYSMNYRNGPSSYDCSSSIYHALIYAGILPQGFRIGNTESMFVDLPKFGFQRIEADINGYIPTQRGDIFIWGKQGYTNGADGHTGIFIDNNNIIHCAYGYNGIHIDNHDKLAEINNTQYLTIFRYTGKPQNAPAPTPYVEKIDDEINVGSHLKFNQIFTVVETRETEGRKEARINELCPVGFTWDENGVPTSWLVKVDNDGYRIGGDINAGDSVKIEGAFVAQEVVQNDNMWFAKINRGGIDVWVELTPATEIPAGEFGTRIENRPQPVQTPEIVEKTPEIKGVISQNEDKKDMSQNIVNEEKQEKAPEQPKIKAMPINERKFTEEEVKMIEDLQKKALDSVDTTEYTPAISEKAKTTVYFVADLGILVNMLVATICVIVMPNFTKEILAISGAVATAFAGLKPIFKLGAKK